MDDNVVLPVKHVLNRPTISMLPIHPYVRLYPWCKLPIQPELGAVRKVRDLIFEHWKWFFDPIWTVIPTPGQTLIGCPIDEMRIEPPE